MKALVLAAGKGTRLGELTREMPKPMLPLGNEPLLAYTLKYLAGQGFDQVAVNLHTMPEVIQKYFGDGSAFGVEITYSYEEELLGTAGAVKNLEDFFSGEDDFLVLYGDLLLNQDLKAMMAFHKERRASATLLLHQRVGSNSLVRMDEESRITAFIERPSEAQRQENPYPWVNSGAQVLNHRMLDLIEPGVFADLPRDVYAKYLADETIYGFPLTGERIAIDSPERYQQAQEAFPKKFSK